MKAHETYEHMTTGIDADPKCTFPALIAKHGLGKLLNYYHRASDYYKEQGVQSSNHNYGGSRSSLYGQLILEQPQTLKGIFVARNRFKKLYGDSTIYSDERSAVLRMLGYSLRSVPSLNSFFINHVRSDNDPMVNADFTFPEGYAPVLDDFSAPEN